MQMLTMLQLLATLDTTINVRVSGLCMFVLLTTFFVLIDCSKRSFDVFNEVLDSFYRLLGFKLNADKMGLCNWNHARDSKEGHCRLITLGFPKYQQGYRP